MVAQNSSSSALVIREPEFAKRLNLACDANPNINFDTRGRGKQKWLYDGLSSRFGVKVSPETVRKWFMGITKPRPSTMTLVAQLLEVDIGWLQLGIKPDLTNSEKKVREAQVGGVVNLVAGMIQMSGSDIAFPEKKVNENTDLVTITGGKQHNIKVVLASLPGNNVIRFALPTKIEGLTILGVIPEGGFSYTLLRIPADIIEAHGENHGGYIGLDVTKSGLNFSVANKVVPRINDLAKLDD